MSDIGKIIRVNALPPLNERENNVIYQVAAPGAATYQDYAIDANGDLKTPSYVSLTGTEEGKPLTKNIEVDYHEEGSVGFISNTPDVSEAVIAIQEGDSVLAESRNNTDNSSSSIFVHHDTGVEISATTPDDQFSAIVDVSGLQGNDYVQPTSDQHYVQRKYVADNFTSQTSLNSTLANYYTKPETYSKTEVDAKFSAVYRPKGSVDNFISLPTTGNVEGDVWNLLDTGANYVWVVNLNNTGTAGWDKLSETVDLTNYVTLNTDQNIESRKQFIRNGGGENWDNNSITLLGLGGKFAGLAFYSSGFDIGQLTFNGNFNFLNQDSTGYKNLVAQGYYKAGSSNDYLLRGAGDHVLMSDFALVTDLSEYVTINTPQVIDARKSFGGATGNNFNSGAIETRGNGATIYPSVGFHQPGNYAGTISLRNSNQFSFKNTDDSDYNYLLSKGYIKDGSDNNYILLGGVGHKAITDFALDVDLDGYVKKSGDTITGTLNARNISAQNSIDKITYDNIENYGSPLKINASASLGIYLQADGNDILYVGPSSIGAGKDILLSNGGIVYTNGDIEHKQVTVGGNATGAIWRNKDGSGNRIAGIGAYTENGDFRWNYIGWGESPWAIADNLAVASDRLTYKGNQVWHAGNFNPVTKANALENATSIGFSNGSFPTNDGSQYPYMTHETAGFIPLATQGFVNDNFNKINRANSLTNASDSNINKTWFDYTWAGGNNAGSVISFSGLNDTYATELFGEYNNGGNRFGLRTHNGDTANTWNPVRWLWHDGNFNPSDFVSITDLNNYIKSRGYWNTALLAKTDSPNSVTFHAEDTNVSGFQSFYGTSLHIKSDQPWYNRLDFPVNAEKLFLYQGINTTDMTLRGYIDILGQNVTNWTSSNLDPSNYIDKISPQDIGNQKRFTGISTEWILDGNSATNARGFVQSLDTGFYTGTVNNKDYGIYRNTVQKILVQDNITTFNTNIYSTGAVIANNYNSNTLAGGVLIATNSLEAYIGNSAMTNLINQIGSAHIWNVAGSNIGYMDAGGLAIYGALLVNNSDVITESQKGISNGVVPLGSDSKISSAYLPSYVDDVLEYVNLTSFPITGETGKIYIALDTNLTYRWGGSSYTLISAGAVQSVNGQTGIVNVTKSDVGLANADNTSDAAKNVLSATKWTTPRTLSYTGDVTGSASVDGSGNVGFAMTLANSGVSAGTYNSVNVDAKGRVLSGTTINYATESYVADLLQQNYFDQSVADERFVNAEGDETINGSKTFSSSPSIPAATSGDHAVNLEQLTANLAHVVNDNDDFKLLEVYRLIDSTPIDLDDTRVKKYNIVFDGSSNGSVNINHLRDNQYYQFSNIAGTGADLRIGVEGYGMVDIVSPGKTAVYMSWGDGKLLKISENTNVSII